MSLRPTPCGGVPAATAAVARAAFPKGNRYLDLRDALGPISDDERFRGLFAVCGRPTERPWRLALVTLLQFAENLSDRRGADAVRGRIDWKHLLGLELADPGFDASVLSELKHPARGRRSRDAALRRSPRPGLGAGVARGRAGGSATCSTLVLGAVRALNCLNCAVESLRAAPGALAVAAPGWLRAHGLSGLGGSLRAARGRRSCATGRGGTPRLRPERGGHDGHAPLSAVMAPDAPARLREVPAALMLRQVWVQTSALDEEDGGLRRRTAPWSAG